MYQMYQSGGCYILHLMLHLEAGKRKQGSFKDLRDLHLNKEQ